MIGVAGSTFEVDLAETSATEYTERLLFVCGLQDGRIVRQVWATWYQLMRVVVVFRHEQFSHETTQKAENKPKPFLLKSLFLYANSHVVI